MIKIAYICHFSTPAIRKRLRLKSFWIGNFLRRIAHIPKVSYTDFATWNNGFIRALENNDNYQCHVISYHLGLRIKSQSFQINTTRYYFLREREHLLKKVWRRIIHSCKEDKYPNSAKRIKGVANTINPDLIIVCGAENPIYSSAALVFQGKPVLIILQTLLNSPKRIELGIGTAYRRELENKIIKHNSYFGSFNLEDVLYINEVNTNAFCFKLMFPSSLPGLVSSQVKVYDFVFFANGLSKYKGTEDVLRGFSYVHERYPQIKINIIGSCDESYKKQLNAIMDNLHIREDVSFHERFPRKIDMLQEVMSAKVAVLPGITAPLNSTVRECMFLGIPVVLYENSVTRIINKEQCCLLTAKMEDCIDLGRKMLYAYEHPLEMAIMAEEARQYADSFFSEKAVGDNFSAIIDAVIGHYYRKETIPMRLLLE